MEEQQKSLGEDQTQNELKPEAEMSRFSQESKTTPESPPEKTPIEAPCDVTLALINLKALGDCLICIHDAQTNGTVEPFDNTIQTVGYMLIAQARCAAAELDLSIGDQP